MCGRAGVLSTFFFIIYISCRCLDRYYIVSAELRGYFVWVAESREDRNYAASFYILGGWVSFSMIARLIKQGLGVSKKIGDKLKN